MGDIVQRLRDQGKDAFAKHYSLGMFKLCDEAATEIEHLRLEHKHACQEIGLAIAERDAADEVSRTAQLYVGAMQEKLAKAIGLLDALLGLELGSGDAAFAFVERHRADAGRSHE